jgi:hypothetical protein
LAISEAGFLRDSQVDATSPHKPDAKINPTLMIALKAG